MPHVNTLGASYVAVVLVLLAEYGYYYDLFNYELFFKNADKIKKGYSGKWVLVGAAVAFLLNVVFVCLIAFDSKHQWDADTRSLTAVLIMQILYYALQLCYVPLLTTKNRKFGFWTALLLFVCAVLQMLSFGFAVSYAAHGAGKYLNMWTAIWTTVFDFWLHAGPFCNNDELWTMSLYKY